MKRCSICCKHPATRRDSETTLDPEKCPGKWRPPIRASSGRRHCARRIHTPRAAARDLESARRNQGHWSCGCSGPGSSHQPAQPSSWSSNEFATASARQPCERRPCGFQAGPLPKESRYLLRDCKIGRQFVGGGALRQLDQPARISHKDRLIGRCECPKPVEHALNLRQPIAGVARFWLSHRRMLNSSKQPYHVQVEQCVRVSDSTIATRPPRLSPQVKATDHHLRRIDQAVVQSRELLGPESTRPMRFFPIDLEDAIGCG